MKNLNADFLLDIWADLKAKRLAPVAVGLAVALVAMPALLLKGEESPSAGPVPIIHAPSADTAEVELAEELAEGGSKLDSYKAHNPFDGLIKPQDDDDASGTAVAPGDSAGDAATDLAKVLGSGGGSTPSTGFDSPSGTGGSGGGLNTGGGTPPVVIKRPGSKYTYELDVRFGRPGREKRYPDLSRMTFLPSPKVPALLFMGVPVDAKSAIFFVHPGLSHAGEGVCMPSKTNCNFLELKVGHEHFLSVDDYEFRIQLLGIKRVKLSDAQTQQRKITGNDRAERGEGPLGSDGQTTQYELPALVDGIG
jgi:hypothetical protein